MREFVIVVCITCGKEFEARRWEVERDPANRRGLGRRKFCSKACVRSPHKFDSQTASEASRRRRNFRYGAKPTTYKKRNGRLEHRFVAEQMLGRVLLPGEVVHHKDRNKHNNDPSNLMVFTSQSEHATHHRLTDGTPSESQGLFYRRP